jgi:hypothetical protein
MWPSELRTEEPEQIDFCDYLRLRIFVEAGEPLIKHSGRGDFPRQWIIAYWLYGNQ